MNKGFIFKCDGLMKILRVPCFISESFNPADGELACGRIHFDALLDTGASTSLITQSVIDQCGLKPIRNSNYQSASGVQKTEVYLINIYLPGSLEFYELPVIRGHFSHGRWNLIIGMDVLKAGEFSVKNVNSKTEFSFLLPSDHRGAIA